MSGTEAFYKKLSGVEIMQKLSNGNGVIAHWIQ